MYAIYDHRPVSRIASHRIVSYRQFRGPTFTARRVLRKITRLRNNEIITFALRLHVRICTRDVLTDVVRFLPAPNETGVARSEETIVCPQCRQLSSYKRIK